MDTMHTTHQVSQYLFVISAFFSLVLRQTATVGQTAGSTADFGDPFGNPFAWPFMFK